MRFVIVLIALILIPVFVGIQLLMYVDQYQPHLRSKVAAAMRTSGIRQGKVALNFLDVSIEGNAADPALRQHAIEAVRAISAIRLSNEAIRITVPANLTGTLTGPTLSLSGWLPPEAASSGIVSLIRDYRPDLQFDTSALHTSADVQLPPGETLPLTPESRLLRPILKSLTVPASLRVDSKSGTLSLSGALPTAALRDAVVKAAKDATGSRFRIEYIHLVAGKFVKEAPFTRSSSLPQFVQSWFRSPAPGGFSIDEAGRPSLSAHATPALESEWLSLLREITGGAPVDAAMILHPSVYHFPGYHTRSEMDDGVIEPLRAALASAVIYFPGGATQIPAEEEPKLSSAMPAISAAGAGLRLIVAGRIPSSNGQVGPGAARDLAETRAQFVINKLIELGLAPGQMRREVFRSLPNEAGSDIEHAVELLVE